MPPLTSLAGKRVVVSGGTTGIGRELIALLGEQGARVLTFGRHQHDLDAALDYALGRAFFIEGSAFSGAGRQWFGATRTPISEYG
jgi:NAD(P)-dependent dehydrogenase (short-subunit alcohol dehydrogenase family)